MKILLDAGHGYNTEGKHSPDGTFYEWAFAREIALAVKTRLKNLGYDAVLLVPEQSDISLQERVRRANNLYKQSNNQAFLVSIHANAAGDGSKWMNARGWECYTSVGNTKSDKIADIFYNQAKKIFLGVKIRTDYSDGDIDKEANFYILKNTLCPAVLTENFFQDNKEDVQYLLSNKGKEDIIEVHVRSIIDYINSTK